MKSTIPYRIPFMGSTERYGTSGYGASKGGPKLSKIPSYNTQLSSDGGGGGYSPTTGPSSYKKDYNTNYQQSSFAPTSNAYLSNKSSQQSTINRPSSVVSQPYSASDYRRQTSYNSGSGYASDYGRSGYASGGYKSDYGSDYGQSGSGGSSDYGRSRYSIGGATASYEQPSTSTITNRSSTVAYMPSPSSYRRTSTDDKSPIRTTTTFGPTGFSYSRSSSREDPSKITSKDTYARVLTTPSYLRNNYSSQPSSSAASYSRNNRDVPTTNYRGSYPRIGREEPRRTDENRDKDSRDPSLQQNRIKNTTEPSQSTTSTSTTTTTTTKSDNRKSKECKAPADFTSESSSSSESSSETESGNEDMICTYMVSRATSPTQKPPPPGGFTKCISATVNTRRTEDLETKSKIKTSNGSTQTSYEDFQKTKQQLTTTSESSNGSSNKNRYVPKGVTKPSPGYYDRYYGKYTSPYVANVNKTSKTQNSTTTKSNNQEDKIILSKSNPNISSKIPIKHQSSPPSQSATNDHENKEYRKSILNMNVGDGENRRSKEPSPRRGQQSPVNRIKSPSPKTNGRRNGRPHAPSSDETDSSDESETKPKDKAPPIEVRRSSRESGTDSQRQSPKGEMHQNRRRRRRGSRDNSTEENDTDGKHGSRQRRRRTSIELPPRPSRHSSKESVATEDRTRSRRHSQHTNEISPASPHKSPLIDMDPRSPRKSNSRDTITLETNQDRPMSRASSPRVYLATPPLHVPTQQIQNQLVHKNIVISKPDDESSEEDDEEEDEEDTTKEPIQMPIQRRVRPVSLDLNVDNNTGLRPIASQQRQASDTSVTSNSQALNVRDIDARRRASTGDRISASVKMHPKEKFIGNLKDIDNLLNDDKGTSETFEDFEKRFEGKSVASSNVKQTQNTTGTTSEDGEDDDDDDEEEEEEDEDEEEEEGLTSSSATEIDAKTVKVHDSKAQQPHLETYTEEIDSSAVRIRENKALASQLHQYTEEIDASGVRIRQPNLMKSQIVSIPTAPPKRVSVTPSTILKSQSTNREIIENIH